MNTRYAVITYTGFSERIDPMLTELSRIGIHNPDVHFDYPAADRELIRRNLRFATPDARVSGWVYCTLNHYRVIKETLSRGFDSLMIFEDDVRFLKDLDTLKYYESVIPDSWDCLRYDYFLSPSQSLPEGRDDAPWHRPVFYSGTGCYRLSRDGMVRLVNLYERGINSGDLRLSDHYLGDWAWGGLNLWAPKIPLCVQVDCPNGGVLGEYVNSVEVRYGRLGVSRDDYMPF